MPDALWFGAPLGAKSTIALIESAAVAWLLTYLVHSTIALGAAWVAERVLPLADAARDVVWKLALVGAIATASVQTLAPRGPVGGELSLGPNDRGTIHPRAMLVERAHALTPPRPLGDRAAVRVAFARVRTLPWHAYLLVGWLVGAGIALLAIARAQASLARALEGREDITRSPLAAPLEALCARAGVARDVRLSWSATLATPVALPGGEICLPRRALVALDAEELESVLAHELAHVVRYDPEWTIAAHAVAGLLFFQPLNRLAIRRTRDGAELLSDAWAVTHTRSPLALARSLATIAGWAGRVRAPRLAAAMVERGGAPLSHRVRRILEGRGAAAEPVRRSAYAAAIGGALSLVALAALAPRVTVPAARAERVTFIVRSTSDARLRLAPELRARVERVELAPHR